MSISFNGVISELLMYSTGSFSTTLQRFYRARVGILTHDIDIANLSVRYVPVLYENGLTYCHRFFSPYGSPIILVLPASKSSRNSDGVTPCGGTKYKRGIKKVRDFGPITRYISQTIQDSAIITMEGG